MHRFLGELPLLVFGFEPQQRFALAHRQPTLGHQLLQVFRQLQQPQEVGDRGPLFTGTLAHFFVAQVQFPYQPGEGLGRFNRVQIRALDVLDEGDLEDFVVRDLLHHHRYLREASHLGGAPAAFARDQFKAIALTPYH